ncbi:GIY-YIG nuclease family protein [Lentzea sp. BCCO 10_0856]|uniref:GIY-YIG nuclease family protein n=1 Tax=Lentzea miocenica TaxID=3095431 RepID=A0ABU4SYN3_9PSEU|nr:GIY-YIG nuclease family protein [Lentzea sp. BCCO 10_0856]MDX8031024.1 GIY-YIG nuclease family protein [Lentzea sp. BCCO 10_0856]
MPEDDSRRTTGIRKPAKSGLPADSVREFRSLLKGALEAKDPAGNVIASAKWGCYAFYDYDGEPIYVGQTVESLRTRIRRHLTNQRTDAVAMRILDVFEVAKLRMWPLWQYQDLDDKVDAVKKSLGKDAAKATRDRAQINLNAVEYSAYLEAIDASRFKAILNEKIPPISIQVPLPASFDFDLVSKETRDQFGHDDVRIARRAETISRLAAVAHERGEVSDGLRRVLVIQAVRLAYIAAERLAYVEGREPPEPSVIDATKLVGSVLRERSDPHGENSSAEDELDEDDFSLFN